MRAGSTAHRIASLLLASCLAGCGEPAPEPRELTVTASAYTSSRRQTDDRPYEAAWGDRLEPGRRSLAVSRDLVALGLDRGTVVEIEGLEGEWVVLDKMAARWRRHIDLYMGIDHEAAREWGRREVTIRWIPKRRDPGGSDEPPG